MEQLFLHLWPLMAIPIGWLWYSANKAHEHAENVQTELTTYKVHVAETLIDMRVAKALEPLMERLDRIETKLDTHMDLK